MPTREAIRAYKEHLNREHGLAYKHRCGSKTGPTKRLYGDYLYAQDREMFMFDMQEEIEKGTFVPPVPKGK